MHKKQIFEIEKKELNAMINEMSIENLHEMLGNIQIHIDLLKCLDKAEYKVIDKDDEVLPDDMPEVKTIYKEEWAPDRTYFIGKFSRNLRGGTIGEEKNIYVPENVVRSLGIEYLDWVKAIVVSRWHGKDKYEYILLEKHKAYDTKSIIEMNRRKIIDYSIVKYEEIVKRFYINGRLEGTGLFHKILLLDCDVKKYKIEKGDIIEYAYWNDEILNGRIAWKYQQEIDEPLEKVIISRSDTIKSISKKSKTRSIAKRAIKPIFEGYKICMVGGGHKSLQKGIKEEVERRHGIFTFCSGDEPKDTLESKIKRADCVIVFTESISHDSMYFTKALCKKHSIIVSYTKNLGSTQFVTRVNLLIKKMNNNNDKTENNLVEEKLVY